MLSGKAAKVTFNDSYIWAGVPSNRRPQPAANKVSPVNDRAFTHVGHRTQGMAWDVQRAERQTFDLELCAVRDELGLGGDATAIGIMAEHLRPREALHERAIATHVVRVMMGRENRAECNPEFRERAFDRC